MASRALRHVPVAALVLLLVLPLWCYFSETGTRLALGIIARSPAIDIEHASGALGGELALQHLRLSTGDVVVLAEDLRLKLEPGCLWHSTICLRTLAIGALEVNAIPSTDAQAAEDPGQPPPSGKAPAETLRFPVAVRAADIAITKTRIRWPGGEWRQGPAQLSLTLKESTLRIGTATLNDAVLALDTGATAAPRTETLSLPTLDLPFTLRVAGLAFNTPTVTVDDTHYPLQRIFLDGRWSGRKLNITQLVVDGAEYGQAQVSDTHISFADNWPIAAAITLQAGSNVPWPPLAGRGASLALAGDAGDLSVEMTSAGPQSLKLVGRVNALDPLLPFSAVLRATADAPLPLRALLELPSYLDDAALLFPLQLSAHGDSNAQTLKLRLQAQIPGYERLAVRLDAENTQAALVVEQLGISDEAAANSLQAAGEIRWREGLSWSVSASSSGLRLPPMNPLLAGSLSGSLSSTGEIGPDNYAISLSDIDLEGEVNQLPAMIRGAIAIADGALLPQSELRATVNDARLTLTPGDSGSVLALHIDDLGRWQAGAGGSLTATARLRDAAKRITLDAALSDLRYNALQVAAGSLQAQLDRTANDTFTGRLHLTRVTWQARTLDALTVSLQGDAENQRLQLDSSGFVTGGLHVSGTRQDTLWEGDLAATPLQFGDQRWTLGNPVALRAENGTLEIAGHCWRHATARVCPGDWLLGRSGGGDMEFDGDLALLAPLVPLRSELSGRLAASAALRWEDAGDLSGTATLRAGPLTVTERLPEGETVELRARSLHADARYDQGELTLQASLLPDSGGELTLDVRMPPARDAPLSGELRIDNLLLAGFDALLPQLADLEGRVDGILRLSGSAEQPLTHGRLRISDGMLALPASPTRLEALDMRIDAAGDSLLLNATAMLGDGPVSLRGEVTTAPNLQLQLQLRGDNNQLLYPPSASLTLSPSLDVTASSERVSVTGEVIVHSGELRIQQLPEGGVELSADVVQVDSSGQVLSEKSPLAIESNVRVRVAEDFRLTGDMLEAALTGELQVRQRSREPLQVFGSLETAGGYVTAYERVLQIQRGVVSFSGAPENPLLDLRAERRISGENITAGIHVHGELARDLALDVYADPPMSQGDAMSYLIWGRSLDSGTNTDGAVLALSLASGVVNRSSLVRNINRVPGISNVSFGAEGSQDEAAATVSGYIGEKLYLSYGFGLYEPVNVLTARLFLQTRLWLEVVSRLENSLDLYYSFDID